MDFKNKIVADAFESYTKIVAPAILDLFRSEINEREKLVTKYFHRLEKVKEELKEIETSADYVEHQRQFRLEIFNILEKQRNRSHQNWLCQLPEHYNGVFKEWIDELPNKVTRKEPFSFYYYSLLKNPFLYPVAFFRNSMAMGIMRIGKIRNGFRKLFRRPEKEVKVFRVRRVPFHQILRFHFHGQVYKQQIDLVEEFLTQYTGEFLALWEQDAQCDHLCNDTLKQTDFDFKARNNELIPVVNKTTNKAKQLKDFEKALQQKTDDAFLQIDEIFNVVDTLYLPKGKYKTKVVDAFCNKTHLKINTLLTGWDRSWHTLLDDWALDVEVNLLYLNVFYHYNQFEKITREYIQDDIGNNFTAIEQYLAKSRERFEDCEGQKASVVQLIEKERKLAVDKLVDKLITELTEKLTICFRSDFRALLDKAIADVESVSEKRTFVKEQYYAAPINGGNINSISPQELLNFEALPVFLAKAEKIMSKVEQNLEEARIKLTGLGSVWDFNLESVAMMLFEKKGSAKDALSAAQEGTTRALELLAETRNLVNDSATILSSDFNTTINQFSDHIQKLTNSESIFELNLKIARIKTLERSRKYRKQMVQGIKDAIPIAVKQIKDAYSKFKTGTDQLQFQLGLKQESKYLAFELSEFINETAAALHKLPFVYQRLYQLTPVDESRFFVNRQMELNSMKKAYENWRKDRFITLAVVGDKGSGVTSLLNQFLKEEKIEKEIYRKTLNEKIHSREQYYTFFSELFSVETFNSNEEIIDFLNKKEEQSVVIIENLHHFYLKKVNGFDNLMYLFDLISNTMKKVLWIGAFTQPVWKYLDKTIRISGYFTSKVYLSAMQTVMIEEIISRRNRISGYRLLFQPDDEFMRLKQYKSADEKRRQEMLRQEFFKKLSRLSYGNISLAQLYWLRLTQKVTERAIEMGRVKEIDFSFVKDLPAEELFVLQTIVLHDGLSLQDYVQVTGKTINSARNVLVPMLEKGLLIRPKIKYNINPIVYYPVVKHLQSRNFIG